MKCIVHHAFILPLWIRGIIPRVMPGEVCRHALQYSAMSEACFNEVLYSELYLGSGEVHAGKGLRQTNCISSVVVIFITGIIAIIIIEFQFLCTISRFFCFSTLVCWTAQRFCGSTVKDFCRLFQF